MGNAKKTAINIPKLSWSIFASILYPLLFRSFTELQ